MACVKKQAGNNSSEYRKLRRPAVSRPLTDAKKLLAKTTKMALSDPCRPMTRSQMVEELFDWIEDAYVARRTWGAIARILGDAGVTIGATVLATKFREERKKRQNAARVVSSPAKAHAPKNTQSLPASVGTAKEVELGHMQPVRGDGAKREVVDVHKLQDAQKTVPEPPAPGDRNIVRIRTDL